MTKWSSQYNMNEALEWKWNWLQWKKKQFHLHCPYFTSVTRAKSAWGHASVVGTVVFPWKTWQRGMRGMDPEQVPCDCYKGSDHTDWMEMSFPHGWFIGRLYHPSEEDPILLVHPLGLGISMVCGRNLPVDKLYAQWWWVGMIICQAAQATVTPGPIGPHVQVTLRWRSAVQVPLSAALILSSLFLNLVRVRMYRAGFSLTPSVCCGLHCALPFQFICLCFNPHCDYI